MQHTGHMMLRTAIETIREQKHLLLEFDGATEPKNPGGVSSSAWAITSLDKDQPQMVLAEECRIVAESGPDSTNNFAEYCGVGLGLKFLCDSKWKGQELTIQGDSQLIIRQLSGEYETRHPRLKLLRARIMDRLKEFGFLCPGNLDSLCEIDNTKCYLNWVPRDMNEYCDALTKRAYETFTQKKFPTRRRKK